MNLSLREQLLQAGLVGSKQAKQAERAEQQKREQAKRQQGPKPAPNAAQQAQSAKLARDQELNRQRQKQREHGARLAEIRQLVEQNRLPLVQSDDYFNFVHKNKVRRIAVDAPLRERIASGAVVIVRYGRFYAPVLAEIAARVAERDANSVVALAAAAPAAAAEDEFYKQFAVPDDLIW